MEEQLEVLLIDDQAEAEVLVRRMLARTEPPSIRVEWANSLGKSLALLGAHAFHAILFDLNLPDSTGLDTLTKVRQHRGKAALIVWTFLEDEELALNAVREGADEYLIKGEVTGPAFARLLCCAVERCRSRFEAPGPGARLGRVLAFAGAKGGTGATTVALNVAAALARQNRSAIAVELKPYYGTFSFQLKHAPANNLSSLAALGTDRINAAEVHKRLCSFPHGLRVLFGPQKPEEYKEIEPEIAVALIQTIAQMAECTVIDLPSQASPMSQAVIRLCHFVSIVLERDPLSVHAGKKFAEVLHSWGISQHMTGAILVNKVVLAAPMSLDDIAAQLGCPVAGVIPPAIELCVKANRSGNPIVFLDSESTFSGALTDLAQRLAGDTVTAFAR